MYIYGLKVCGTNETNNEIKSFFPHFSIPVIRLCHQKDHRQLYNYIHISSHNIVKSESIQVICMNHPEQEQQQHRMMIPINRVGCMCANSLHMKIRYEEMWPNQMIVLSNGMYIFKEKNKKTKKSNVCDKFPMNEQMN